MAAFLQISALLALLAAGGMIYSVKSDIQLGFGLVLLAFAPLLLGVAEIINRIDRRDRN